MIRPHFFCFIAGERQARGVEGRRQVDRHDRVPFVRREALDRRDVLDAGIVDEDVGRAELGGAAGDHRLDLRRVGQVGAVVQARPARPSASRSRPRSPKPLSITFAPSAASARAIARPMPEVEPVTSATLPSRIMTSPLASASRHRVPLLQPGEGLAHYGVTAGETCMVRLGGEDPSSNFEDRTGQGGGFGFGGGGGGNLLGCLLPLVMSRFGIVGVLILLLGYCALTQLGGGGGWSSPSGPTTSAPAAAQSTPRPRTCGDFLTRVLGSTEETWRRDLRERAAHAISRPRMVAYSQRNADRAAAWARRRWGRSTARPTRRSTSTRISSTSLSRRFQAPGDFAAGSM